MTILFRRTAFGLLLCAAFLIGCDTKPAQETTTSDSTAISDSTPIAPVSPTNLETAINPIKQRELLMQEYQNAQVVQPTNLKTTGTSHTGQITLTSTPIKIDTRWRKVTIGEEMQEGDRVFAFDGISETQIPTKDAYSFSANATMQCLRFDPAGDDAGRGIIVIVEEPK
jgi:hypothetical protein